MLANIGNLERKRTGPTRTVFLVCALLSLHGCVSAEAKDDERTTLQGTLHLIGNEPFAVLALHIEDGRQIRIVHKDAEQFRRYIGRRVTMSGRMRERELTTADGKRTFVEFYLDEPRLEATHDTSRE